MIAHKRLVVNYQDAARVNHAVTTLVVFDLNLVITACLQNLMVRTCSTKVIEMGESSLVLLGFALGYDQYPK